MVYTVSGTLLNFIDFELFNHKNKISSVPINNKNFVNSVWKILINFDNDFDEVSYQTWLIVSRHIRYPN